MPTTSGDHETTDSTTCAGPRCDVPRPPKATARWRFCSTACRQASYRARSRGGVAADTAVPTLDEELCATVMRLLDAVFRARGGLAEGATPRSAEVAHLIGLAQEATDAAVARDRAAGVSWSEIADSLGITFATARRKYGTRTAEALARFRVGPPDGGSGAPEPRTPEKVV
ncbi:hypothetical protein [Nocardiopsis kunsanensis]|uniref:hypothetical protein n=1 Tax=Nocardiopsis kunsanensis TaxID=141693 RepID=UPI001268FB27|nr:hypothetical protein [Nocardiopsis kunsanensis]